MLLQGILFYYKQQHLMKKSLQDATLKPPRALPRLLHALALLIVLLFVFTMHLLQNERDKDAQTFDDDIRDFWTEHIETFPVQAKDRYAFHEMGFRTAKYAEGLLLNEPRQLEQTARLESALWGFMSPAVQDNRLAAQTRSQKMKESNRKRRYGNQFIANSWFQKKFSENSWYSKKKKSQGVVTIAERDNLHATVELVTTLRYSFKDDVPIEIFYYGNDDLPDLIDNALSMMPGVRTIDLSSISLFGEADFDGMLLANMTHKRSSALQALALLSSSFDEMVYAAPGTVFLQRPLEMLKDQGYRSTGTLFFHGLNTAQLADSNRFLNFLRQQFDQGQPTSDLASSPFYNFGINSQQDPRVLVLDKSRAGVFASLLLNIWLHSPPVRESIWHAHFPECESQREEGKGVVEDAKE